MGCAEIILHNHAKELLLQRADHPLPGPRCSEGVLADHPNSPKFTLALKDLPSKSCVSELTFRMLGDAGWLQSSSLITFQCVACHELIASLIQCGQIVSCFVHKHFNIGPPPCQRLTPRGLLTRRTFSSFQDLQ